MEAFAFNSVEQTLFMTSIVFLCIQVLYYLILYNRIYRHNQAAPKLPYTNEKQPLSVIIYSQEEISDIQNNLIAILEQDYPSFEVIVINDGHSEENDMLLTQLEKKYPQLYHSFVPESSRYISRKKLAITLGIRASKYEWVVMTEANCKPQSNQWLQLLARNFTPHTQIVLGYSGYERGKGWNCRRIEYDNLFMSMRYLSLALARSPYMGIGRNLAYRKSLFYEQKGFSAHLNLQRGDDDLFINQIANAENTRVETDNQSIMRVPPVTRLKEWKEEKIGYALTARFYRGLQRQLWGFETTSRLLFYAAGISLMAFSLMNTHWLIAGLVVLIFLMRFTIQAIVINLTANSLNENRHYYLSLFLFDWVQPIQSLYWKWQCIFSEKERFLRK